MISYEVKEIVCDYGIYERINNEKKQKLCVILNNRDNAELIVKILEKDLEHKKFNYELETL